MESPREHALSADDVAELRRWFRRRLGTAPPPHFPPAWLGQQSAGRLRVLVGDLLHEEVNGGRLRPAAAAVWATDAGLYGERATQAESARRWNVTARTVRNWIRTADSLLADSLARVELSYPPGPALRHDEVRLAALLAELECRMHADQAPAEHVEAVRAFRSDRLGGDRRPRRGGADRSRRKRAYDRIPEQIDLIKARPVPPALQMEDPGEGGGLVTSPYRLEREPAGALEELSRAWVNLDREFIPLMANQALRVLAGRDVPRSWRLTALEIIANALRDAENLQAYAIARRWAELSAATYSANDVRAWKARGIVIHLMQIHGHTAAALGAQRQQVQAFSRIAYEDEDDHAGHRQDRLARLLDLELQSSTDGGFRRAESILTAMRDQEDRGLCEVPSARYILLRRRVEISLARALRAAGRRPVVDRPELRHLVGALEDEVPRLSTTQALSAINVLAARDVATRDWDALREHVQGFRVLASQPGATANLTERLNQRTREAALLGGPELPRVPVPSDPFRLPKFIPRRPRLPLSSTESM